jgi:hypothetical protein
MNKSTFISTALHTAIVLWLLVAFPAAKIDQQLLQIPIDLATPAEVTKLKAGTKDAKDDAPLAGKPKEKLPEAVKEAEKPEQTAAVEQKSEPQPKPKPEAKKAEAPKEPAPKPEAKKPEDKPAKEKKAETPPKKPAPAKPKRDFNTDRIAALLNKIPDAADEAAPVLPSEEPAPKKVRGQSNGTEMAMSVNEIDALRARIAQCWSPPPGGLGAEQIVVKLRMRLNEDGTLVGYPTVANS